MIRYKILKTWPKTKSGKKKKTIEPKKNFFCVGVCVAVCCHTTFLAFFSLNMTTSKQMINS